MDVTIPGMLPQGTYINNMITFQ